MHVAEGWEVETFLNRVVISTSDCTGQYFSVIGRLSSDINNNLFIAYASGYGMDIDVNGRFFSLYLTKTASYAESNSDVSVKFISVNNTNDYVGSIDGTHYFTTERDDIIETPSIGQTVQYMVGDATGDDIIDASDASEILRGLRLYSGDGSINAVQVPMISSCFTTYFPDAKAPAAPDANSDNFITEMDATRVLSYYTSLSVNDNIDGPTGQYALYEYYTWRIVIKQYYTTSLIHLTNHTDFNWCGLMCIMHKLECFLC